MQVYEQLAQIIDSVVDELQDANIDADIAVSTHDGSIGKIMWMPHPGKYNYYYPDRPGIQRLYDTGKVMNNEAPVFMDSIQITQTCMKDHEYTTMNTKWYYKH